MSQSCHCWVWEEYYPTLAAGGSTARWCSASPRLVALHCCCGCWQEATKGWRVSWHKAAPCPSLGDSYDSAVCRGVRPLLKCAEGEQADAESRTSSVDAGDFAEVDGFDAVGAVVSYRCDTCGSLQPCYEEALHSPAQKQLLYQGVQ